MVQLDFCVLDLKSFIVSNFSRFFSVCHSFLNMEYFVIILLTILQSTFVCEGWFVSLIVWVYFVIAVVEIPINFN